MPRRRWIIALAIFAALLVAAEVAVRRWESPKACVQIVNEGDELMEDVVVVYADTRMPVGSIAANHSAHVRLTAGPIGPLRLEYRQKGNAIQGYQIADFDPVGLVQDAKKQMLIVGTNQLQRSLEDDGALKSDESLGQMLRRWFDAELNPPP
jgi:hypothetical protein